MTKNKHGNNKDGLGIMDLMCLGPIRYWFTILAIRRGWIKLAKRILDVK